MSNSKILSDLSSAISQLTIGSYVHMDGDEMIRKRLICQKLIDQMDMIVNSFPDDDLKNELLYHISSYMKEKFDYYEP